MSSIFFHLWIFHLHTSLICSTCEYSAYTSFIYSTCEYCAYTSTIESNGDCLHWGNSFSDFGTGHSITNWQISEFNTCTSGKTNLCLGLTPAEVRSTATLKRTTKETAAWFHTGKHWREPPRRLPCDSIQENTEENNQGDCRVIPYRKTLKRTTKETAAWFHTGKHWREPPRRLPRDSIQENTEENNQGDCRVIPYRKTLKRTTKETAAWFHTGKHFAMTGWSSSSCFNFKCIP